MTIVNEYLIAMGANLPSDVGTPMDTLHAAVARMHECGFSDVLTSPFYATPCFPAGAGPDYVNAAAIVKCLFAPQDVMHILHEIEAEFGRERVQRWGQRTLDLDLIAAESLILPNEQFFKHWHDLSEEEQQRVAPDRLVVPHPRLHERAFVLVPLADVVPDWRHPVLGVSVLEMLESLDKTEIDAVMEL